MTEIDKLRKNILALWSLLQSENHNLIDLIKSDKSNLTYTPTTFSLLSAEYSRCLDLKEISLKELIKKERQKIVQLWDVCMFGHKDRAEFRQNMESGM